MIVHVGHGKTGTSFLQSIFALNKEVLKEHGYHYPEHPSEEKAAKGLISSGNGKLILENNFFDTEHEKLLFSNESLFRELADNSARLISLTSLYNLEVVIYTRNVIDHRISHWGQNIKRGGGWLDLNTFLTNQKYDVLRYVLKWIRLSEEIGFTLTLRNYSKCEGSLVEDFFKYALNIQSNYNLKYPDQKIVNRSLGFVEYELQRVFNAAFGKQSSRYISDFLVQKFPHVIAWEASLTENVYEKISHENLNFINQINEFLDDNIHLEIGSREKWVNKSEERIQPLDNEICETVIPHLIN